MRSSVATVLLLATLLALLRGPGVHARDGEEDTLQENLLDTIMISPWKFIQPPHHLPAPLAYQDEDSSMDEGMGRIGRVHTPGPLHKKESLRNTLWLPRPLTHVDYAYRHHNQEHEQGYGNLHRTRYSTEDDTPLEEGAEEEQKPAEDLWDESLVPTASSDISSWESSEEDGADDNGEDGEEDEEEDEDAREEDKLESSSSSSSSSSAPSSSEEESTTTSARIRNSRARANRRRLSEWFDWHMSNCHSSEASNRSCRWVCTDRKRNPWGFGCCRCKPITTTSAPTTTISSPVSQRSSMLLLQPFLIPLLHPSSPMGQNKGPIMTTTPSASAQKVPPRAAQDELSFLLLRPNKVSHSAEEDDGDMNQNMMQHNNLLLERKRRR